MRIFLFLLLLTFTFGCATRNIKYDRNKILKKYSAEYKIYLDNEETDLETVFLDKENIENVRIDKHSRKLKISQIKETRLFNISELNLDSIGWKKNKTGIIVIDGNPITDSLKQHIKIDINSIKAISILKMNRNENTTFDKDVFLISLK